MDGKAQNEQTGRFRRALELSAAIVLVLCLSLAVFGVFFREHYSVDMYNVSRDLYHGALMHLSNGRVVSCLLYLALYSLGFDYSSHIFLQSLLLCLAVAISTVTVANELRSSMKKSSFSVFLLLVLFVSFAYCNCYFSEWFCFTECAVMYAVSVLSSAYGAVCLSRGRRGAAFLLAFCCYNSYQVGLAYFVFWFMLLTALKHDFCLTRRAIWEIVTAALLCALVFLVNMVIVKAVYRRFLFTGRYGSFSAEALPENIRGVGEVVADFFRNGNSLMDGPWLAIAGALPAAGVVCLLLRRRAPLPSLLFLVLILLGGGAVVLLPQIIVELWAPPRALVPLFAWYSVVFVYLLYYSDGRGRRALLLLPAVLLLIVNVSESWSYGQDMILTNVWDRAFAQEVCDRIEDYEAETGREVTTVSVGFDDAVSWFWDIGDSYRWSLCVRACTTEWADVCSINYFTGREFERVKMSEEERQTYFSDLNWSELDLDEQLVLDGATAYLLIY